MNVEKKFYGTSVSIAISLIGGLGLLIAPEIYPENLVLRDAVCMITVISAFYTFVSLIARKIVEDIKKEHHLILQSIIPLSTGLTAKNYYPASAQPNIEFNTLIDEEMCITKSYFYFSNKAFFHTTRLIRLLHKAQRNASFTIALPDLNEDQIFRAMADNLYESMRVKGGAHGSKDDYIKQARMETFQSIFYILKLKQEHDNIHLYLHKEIPFIRFELTDNLLAISFLPMIKEGYYPPSMIYDKKSLYWETFSAYSQQILNRSIPLETQDITDYIKNCYEKYNIDGNGVYDSYLDTLEIAYKELKNKILSE